MMSGIDGNGWQISKRGEFDGKDQTIELAKGEIVNFKMEKDKPYWLKAELRGTKIVFYLSLDGENFAEIGEVHDTSFSGGGVGIASSGNSLFLVDEFQFFQ